MNLKYEALKIKLEKTEELLNLYRHDKLTGLLMRRDYDDKFLDFFESNEVFFLTLIDINGLHTVNRDPKQGYTFGDDLIISVAHKLSNATNNIVYRIGGDEFAILSYEELVLLDDLRYAHATLPNTDCVSIREMKNKVDKEIITRKELFYKTHSRREAKTTQR